MTRLVTLGICRFFQKPSFCLTQLCEDFRTYHGRFGHNIPQDLEIVVRTAIDIKERPLSLTFVHFYLFLWSLIH